MDLDAYLHRIGFAGTPKPNADTLRQMHRQHLLRIPYENLDVQLQRTVDLDIQRIYTKIVDQGRGGWCYEMNGLLEWALKETGFEVARLSAGVRRAERGDAVLGNHLVLAVQLDELWLADVGFGDGAFEPVPLKPHAFEQRGFTYELEQMDDYWRFHNHLGGAADSYDFMLAPADENQFAQQSSWLSTSPESRFVLNLTCMKFTPQGYEILKDRFGLDVPEVAGLWDKIAARHEVLFGQ